MQSLSSHPLVSTAVLAEALEGPNPPVVLDVRWRLGGPPGRNDYQQAHLPGAVFVDLDRELAGPPGPAGRHPLPDAEDLQRVLRAAGVRAGHPVVAYDDGDGSVAARVWWLLRWGGHRQVAVLDGGYAAWVGQGRPVTDRVPDPVPGDIVLRPGAMPVLDADQAAGLARNGVLLDARAPQRYRGEVEPVDPRAGHIPGAVNAPAAGNVGADGHWLSPARLRDRFTELGVPEQGVAGQDVAEQGGVGLDVAGSGATRPAVGAYCGSGVTASSVVLALEVAGLTTAEHPAALYAGSWSNWSADPDRPAATGPEPDGDQEPDGDPTRGC